MSTGEITTIALVVLVPAVLLWVIFLARTGSSSRNPLAGIPRALRPGTPDDQLEGKRLERILVGGVLSTIAVAIFIPLYWLPEAQRNEAFAEQFAEESVHRGQLIFSKAPDIEEAEEPGSNFKEVEQAIALGQACVACHGSSEGDNPAAGGVAPFKDPVTQKDITYTAPPLNNVFSRWDEEVVKLTIERGRPGTPMPAWGVDYGGSMTEQMVNDVMAWLRSIQVGTPKLSEGCLDPKPDDVKCGQEIFEARCAVCHGDQAQGKDDQTLHPNQFDTEFGKPQPIWHQGMALWKGDVKHLSVDQHITTIRNGRRLAFMPPFGEAPGPGVIPVPPNPLTDNQIKAVVAYERSL